LVLAPAAAAQVGYAVDSNLDQLISVDLATANVTLIGSTLNNGLETPAGLAWRPDTSELWVIDLGGGEVGTLDLNNATFTPVFMTNLSGWQGMAWDAARSLFILANQDDNTYVLDPATGVTTLVGNSTFGLITAMDFDPVGVLWGIDFSGAIVQLDPISGVGTNAGTTIPAIQGLAIDNAGTWYAMSTNTDSLYTIDPTTGVETLIGMTPGLQFVKGFEIPTSGGVPSLGSAYCSPAVVNTSGASATIIATGSTVAANNNVTLTASSMPLNQFGFFLTSMTQGNVANPGGSNGVLCLGGTIGRYVGPGFIKNSGATGSFNLMLNLTQTPAGPVFVSIAPGQTWNFQAWFRDIGPMGQPQSNFTDGRSITFQ